MIKNKIIAILLVLLLSTNLIAAPNNSLCTSDEYVIGFFNGVWNTEMDAYAGAEALKEMVTSQLDALLIDPDSVQYEIFYNHTGNATGETMFQDIAEVFIQRAEEISPDYSNNFELFWSAVTGDGDGFLEKARNMINPRNNVQASTDLVLGLLSDLYTDITTEVSSGISGLLSDPPTQADYTRHSSRIKTLALEGNKLLLIAHSQGNLFVNHAYNNALTIDNYSTSSIGVVHIAPASSQIIGPHILANLDFVINGLRAFGGNTVPTVTVDIPASHLMKDPSGHTLVGTYLNKDIPTYSQVISSIMSTLGGLESPSSAEASAGAFTVTLTWDGRGDIDLHTFEPDGSHVNFNSPAGVSGYLDVDNVDGFGPEHYFASCDRETLRPGKYRIGLNNFSQATGRIATVQVSTPNIADLLTKTVRMGSEGSSQTPDMLVEVDVVNTAGRYSITAH